MALLFQHALGHSDVASLSTVFPFISDPGRELLRGYRFWCHVVRVVSFIYEHREIREPFYREVLAADAWFTERMEPLLQSILGQQ